MSVHITAPEEQVVPMQPDGRGYHFVEVDGVGAETRYTYVLADGVERPDPASRYQPEGVHGSSEVVDPQSFDWTDDDWRGIAREQLVFYELHVGTFTEEGTFDAVIPHLQDLADLGITAIELMPVNQCPGERNWGYDGVDLFAVQASYGGPEGLRRLVDAAHGHGLAVYLDVVYNHLGPEGNYLAEFAPYFTNRYSTPWGPALNYDGRHSDEVRRFFIQNGLYWVGEYHIDGFRLDAIHAIYDLTARPFLREFTEAVHDLAARHGRQVHVVAESIMNHPAVCNPPQVGGFGMDAEWNDDFHHAIHALVTGEHTGYYGDFGRFSDLVTAYRSGFIYTGEHMGFRGRRHGDVPRLYDGANYVVFAQNHDQVGNRAQGDRLSTMVPFEMQKAIAGLAILSPYLPLLFMGEEYGEIQPFQYFVDHGDPDLIQAVREGREREFAIFEWQGDVPDPQSEATFERSRLRRERANRSPHKEMKEYHRTLLRLRREQPALANLAQDRMEVVQYQAEKFLFVRRYAGDDEVCQIISLSRSGGSTIFPFPDGRWDLLLDSSASEWAGPGSSSPESLESNGEVALSVDPMRCLVYGRRLDDRVST